MYSCAGISPLLLDGAIFQSPISVVSSKSSCSTTNNAQEVSEAFAVDQLDHLNQIHVLLHEA
jgi:hypothetical protein